MRGRRKTARGAFTLVEVLASLALVGIILPVAMAGISLAMGLGDSARHNAEAATLARSRLTEIVATGDWQSDSTQGDFGDEWPRYSWQLNVEDWEEPGLKEVTLSVLRPQGRSKRTVTMTTLVYAGGE
jgi:general secretion pathway protein I